MTLNKAELNFVIGTIEVVVRQDNCIEFPDGIETISIPEMEELIKEAKEFIEYRNGRK